MIVVFIDIDKDGNDDDDDNEVIVVMPGTVIRKTGLGGTTKILSACKVKKKCRRQGKEGANLVCYY